MQCYEFFNEFLKHYAELKKPETKDSLLRDSIYTKFLEKAKPERRKVDW